MYTFPLSVGVSRVGGSKSDGVLPMLPVDMGLVVRWIGEVSEGGREGGSEELGN